MLFPKSIDFHSYLIDYEFFQKYLPNQTRKQFKNKLMTLYGKKKDRGYLKKKFIQTKREWESRNKLIVGAIAQKFPFLMGYL